MSQQKLTDRAAISQANVKHSNLVHLVDTLDLSQDPAGSSYKGSLNQVGILMNSRNKVAYVDPVFGEDLSLGVVGRSDRPYQTVKAAEAALIAATYAVGRGAIHGRPGLYTGSGNELIGEHGINYHFENGVEFQTSDATFADYTMSAGEYFSVSGWGKFVSTSKHVDLINGTKLIFQSKSSNTTFDSVGFYVNNDSILYVLGGDHEHSGGSNTESIFWLEDAGAGTAQMHIHATTIFRSTANAAPLVRVKAGTQAARCFIKADYMHNLFSGIILTVQDGGYTEIDARMEYGSHRGITVENSSGGTGKLVIKGSLHSGVSNNGSLFIETPDFEVISDATITGFGYIRVNEADMILRVLKDVLVDPNGATPALFITAGSTAYTYNCTIQNLFADDAAHGVEMEDDTATYVPSGTTVLINQSNANSRSVFCPDPHTYVGKAFYANRILDANVTNLLPGGVEVIDANVI